MLLCTDQRNADDDCVRLPLCLSLFVCIYPSISRFSFLSSQIQTVEPIWIREENPQNPEQPKKEKAKVQRTAPPPKKEEEPNPPALAKKEKAKVQRSAAKKSVAPVAEAVVVEKTPARKVGLGLLLGNQTFSRRTYVEEIVPGFAAHRSGQFKVSAHAHTPHGLACTRKSRFPAGRHT